jgi:hypothetical protein
MTYIYDGILESHEAREIAEENKKNHGIEQTEEDAAKEWFGAVIYGGEGRFDDMPKYSRFVDSIDDEWDLYYDYGADYYFAVHNNMEKE